MEWPSLNARGAEAPSIGNLPALPAVVAPLTFAVTTATRLLLLEALLFRRLHVRHVLAILPKNAAPVHLTPKALERAIDGLVISYLYTNSQRESLLEKSRFGI